MHHIVNFRQAALEDKLEQFDQHGKAQTDQQGLPPLHAFEGAEQKADGNEGKDIHNHLDQDIIPSFPDRLVAPKGREVVGPFRLGVSDKDRQVKEHKQILHQQPSRRPLQPLLPSQDRHKQDRSQDECRYKSYDKTRRDIAERIGNEALKLVNHTQISSPAYLIFRPNTVQRII